MKILRTFTTILLLCLSVSVSAELQSTVDRSRISIEETLNLTVRYTGSKNGQPDFSQLEQQFEILSRQQSNQFRSFNGQSTSFTEWKMIIAPREEGKLLIPSFKFDGQYSDAVTITVTPADATPAGKTQDVFLQTIVDKNTSYVQEQIKVTFRLHYAVNIDGLDAQPMQFEDAILEQLPDVKYRKNINGRFYNVAEFSYALYPQTSGNLVIPSLQWNAKISVGGRPRSLFDSGRYELKRMRTEAKTISVNPVPEEFPKDATWLPAQNIKLDESWSNDLGQIKVGEPITRTLTLTANGLMSSQLPVIMKDDNSNAIKFYADQPKQNDDKKSSGIVSSRIESAAVVFNQHGEATVPGTKIPWWDTKNKQLKYAEIPARKIVVAEGESQHSSANTAQTNAISNTSDASPNSLLNIEEEIIQKYQRALTIWKSLTGIFVLLWLVFVVLWWQARNRAGTPHQVVNTREQTDLKAALNALKKACRENKTQDARKNLLIWAQRYWEDPSIFTLSAVSQRIDDSATQNQISLLDANMFSQNNDNWNGELLLNAMNKWLDQKREKEKQVAHTLPPLYTNAN